MYSNMFSISIYLPTFLYESSVMFDQKETEFMETSITKNTTHFNHLHTMIYYTEIQIIDI